MSEAIDIAELERLYDRAKDRLRPSLFSREWEDYQRDRDAAVNALPGMIEEIKWLREMKDPYEEARKFLGDPIKGVSFPPADCNCPECQARRTL